MTEKASPVIRKIAWGRIETDLLGQSRDVKLWPGGGRAWDWNESGTSHSRGVQVEDVKELVEHGARVVVLTRGMLLRLRVPDKVKHYLEKQNVEVVIVSTKEGVQLYNDYAARNVPVGGLFHTTC
ncbi:MAG: MTH938/NDUFAF3 family protein [Desulfopila sp.]